MKTRNDPVVVHCYADKTPQTFVWKGRLYRIMSIEDKWRQCGRWWLDGMGYRRNYFRVTARPPGYGRILHADIYQQGAQWMLESECD